MKLIKLDFDKLPEKIGGILQNYLSIKFNKTPEEALLLNLLIKISQICSYKRAKVAYKEATTIINMYGLLFMKSGSGKDAPLREIDRIFMGEYYKDFNINLTNYIKFTKEKISNEAEEKFQKSVASKENFMEEQAPRQIVTEFSDATPEGLIAQRESLASVEWGGTFLRIAEYADYISSENNARREMTSIIIDIFDHGDSKPKIIKSAKNYKAIYGIPSTVMLHTSPNGLLEGKGRRDLMQFLNRGLGRRAFIISPNTENMRNRSRGEVRDAELEEIESLIPSFILIFNECVNKNKFNQIFTFTKEANQKIEDYTENNFDKGLKISKLAEEALVAELQNRHWKTVKLAGIIAAFEHPGEYEVTLQDLDFAIYIADLFGEHFASFFEIKELTNENKLFIFFKENMNKPITTMDIRLRNFVYKDNFKNWFDNAISDITEMALIEDLDLIIQKNGKSGKTYTLIDPVQLIKDL